MLFFESPRCSLPGLSVDFPTGRSLYHRISQTPAVSSALFTPKRLVRDWSQADKDTLKRGLLDLHKNTHYPRLQNKFYALSQYVMHGRFSPSEVASAIRKINAGHKDWQL
jgi:hypothetical protein